MIDGNQNQFYSIDFYKKIYRDEFLRDNIDNGNAKATQSKANGNAKLQSNTTANAQTEGQRQRKFRQWQRKFCTQSATQTVGNGNANYRQRKLQATTIIK